MAGYSIILADDHPVVMWGVRNVVEKRHYRVVGEYSNGIVCAQNLLMKKPDLAIIDLDMPGMAGIEVVRKAKACGLHTKFVILTMDKSESRFLEAKGLGVEGYVFKDDIEKSIDTCIAEVMSGRDFVSRDIYTKLIPKKNDNMLLEKFTSTEQKIIKLIALGKKSTEIAEILYIAKRTVDTHRYSITKKITKMDSTFFTLKQWVDKNRDEIGIT